MLRSGAQGGLKRPRQKSTDTNLVRPSRAGDQFHYLWAARRCLNLLLPGSDLKAVTIEGASPSETTSSGPIRAGEEVIDVGEYFGDRDFERASRVRYIQLKHSTEAPNKPWPPSGLQNTIEGFAKRYKAILAAPATSGRRPDLEFVFVTNRPISPSFTAAVESAAKGLPVKPADLEKLEKYAGLNGSELSTFCKLLKLDGKHNALWDQRHILFQDVSEYLPDADVDAPTQLKELVTRKALPEAATNPTIERFDVLRALKTDEDRLYPVPCRIEQLNDAISLGAKACLQRELKALKFDIAAIERVQLRERFRRESQGHQFVKLAGLKHELRQCCGNVGATGGKWFDACNEPGEFGSRWLELFAKPRFGRFVEKLDGVACDNEGPAKVVCKALDGGGGNA